MPLFSNFVGPAYRARSAVMAADTLINLFVEVAEVAEEAKQGALYGTPGLKNLMTIIGAAGCRGAFQVDNRGWVVCGPLVFELSLPFFTTATFIGSVTDDGLPVTMASNGRGGEQLLICSAGQLYVFSLTTGAFTGPIVVPFLNQAVMIDYIDGYFIVNEKNTPTVWFSALEDGTSWSGLDNFVRSETSDNIIGIKVLNNRVWTMGSQSGEIYYNTGDATNPFQPFPGTVMQEGLVCYSAIAISGESLVWLAQDSQGRNRIVTASSPQPAVLSTPPISFALANYATIDDCEVLSYEQEGHPRVAFTFPSVGITWCYDQRSKGWLQLQGWDNASGTYVRWRARGFCSFMQKLIVGDYQNGNLYTLDLDTFTDNGSTLMRERTAPYLGTDNQSLFLDQFELGMEAGVGLASGQGSDPQLMLDVSWDGAKTWGPVTTASVGKMGDYGAAADWHQLGSGRQDKLVLRVRQSDPVRAVWGPGAWIRATPGTGQR